MKVLFLILFTLTIIRANNVYYAPITLIYGLHTKKTTVAPITHVYTDSLEASNSIKKKFPTLIPDCCIISTDVIRIKLDSNFIFLEIIK